MAGKQKRIDVVYKGSKELWIAVQDGVVVDMAIERDELLQSVASTAEASAGTVVVVHTPDGEVEEERSYPAAAGMSTSEA